MTISYSGSSSLDQPEYWWYRARSALLEAALGSYLGAPSLVIDVGSADGPSVGWMRGPHHRVMLDMQPKGLAPGGSVCGSALQLPFGDGVFDVVAAFDVVEHCEPEDKVMSELARVLAPGGRLLLSVPAYQWAWSGHDVRAGHHRRYTRPRIVNLVEHSGLRVERSTYAFTAVFPFFVAERGLQRLMQRAGRDESARLAPVPVFVDRILMGLCNVETRVLGRSNLPYGSSVLLAATKP
jgi:SAM-dependent methyltransferase